MKVYVTGPDVFRFDATKHLDKIRKLLKDKGIEALIPLDNEINESSYEDDVAAQIYRSNIKMIDECDVIMANIAPFRGLHMDPGTAFEIGYAAAKGKKIYAYTPHAYEPLSDRFPTIGWDENGYQIDNFGETENLMITVPCDCLFRTVEETVNAIATNLRSS